MVLHQDGRVLHATDGWPAASASGSAGPDAESTGLDPETLRNGSQCEERRGRRTPAWIEAAARQLRADGPGEFVFAMADDSWIAGKLARDGRAVLIHSAAKSGQHAMAVAKQLRRMMAEMTTEQDSAALVREFSNRLSRSFEETAAVFRILRLMTSRDEPRGQLELVCNIVQQALPFGWVSVVFSDSPCVLDVLRGSMLIGGQPRGGAAAVEPYLLRLAAGIVCDDWTRVQCVGDGPIADATGGEVVYDPITHDGKVIGILAAGNKCGEGAHIEGSELQFIDACADFVGVFHENLARYNEQKAASIGVLKALVASIDAKDPYTMGHSERVAELSTLIARGIGFEPEQIERVRVAGLVHDVGKIGIPDWVLRKPGKLDDQEFALVRMHPETGYRILKDVPLMSDVLPAVLEHHERYDGKGYPYGIKGEQISLLGRIVAIADSFDAMCSSRAYRTGLDRAKALAEVANCSGTQYDPNLVEVFLKLDLSSYDAMLVQETEQKPMEPPQNLAA